MNHLSYKDVWMPLERKETYLTSSITIDEIVSLACSKFDYTVNEIQKFQPYELPNLPKNWNIGLIVGASGTGKSTLLQEFNQIMNFDWEKNKPIISHFEDSEKAVELFYAVGLSSVPTWCKPFSVLSTGEKFRANLARAITDNSVIDEFTSVVDRNIAQAASKTLKKYIKEKNIKNLVFASCHRDIISWLEPDWIIDTDAGQWCFEPKESVRRGEIIAEIYEVEKTLWKNFAQYHYLTNDLSPFARCFVAAINGQAVSFYAVLSYPSGTVRNAFRGHRLVTHPDFQGLGIGPKLSDWVAGLYVANGKRFFAKTSHPRLGEYREKSLLWKATSKNKKYRKEPVSHH